MTTKDGGAEGTGPLTAEELAVLCAACGLPRGLHWADGNRSRCPMGIIHRDGLPQGAEDTFAPVPYGLIADVGDSAVARMTSPELEPRKDRPKDDGASVRCARCRARWADHVIGMGGGANCPGRNGALFVPAEEHPSDPIDPEQTLAKCARCSVSFGSHLIDVGEGPRCPQLEDGRVVTFVPEPVRRGAVVRGIVPEAPLDPDAVPACYGVELVAFGMFVGEMAGRHPDRPHLGWPDWLAEDLEIRTLYRRAAWRWIQPMDLPRFLLSPPAGEAPLDTELPAALATVQSDVQAIVAAMPVPKP